MGNKTFKTLEKLKMKKKRVETNYLYWINPQTKKRYPAGVAFFEEKYGEYRLKLDIYRGKRVYLKPIGSNNGQVNYRLEEAQNRRGKFIRVEMGRGLSQEGKPETVFVEVSPNFEAVLCLEMKRGA